MCIVKEWRAIAHALCGVVLAVACRLLYNRVFDANAFPVAAKWRSSDDEGVMKLSVGMARRSWLRLGVMVLLWAALALRLVELTRQNIWWDEARNIDVALRPFLQVATAPELDIHPPVYFWLLHGWGRWIGLEAQGEAPQLLAYAMRFASVWAGVLAVAMVFALGRRFGWAAALVVAVLCAFSPFWLAESQEARMYTVGFAAITAAALAWLAAFDRLAQHGSETGLMPPPRDPVGLLALFVVLSALSLLIHYNAAFVLAAWYMGWGAWALLRRSLWRDRWRQVRVLIGCGLATAVLVAPVAPIALRQIPGYANPNLIVPSVQEYLWQNWQAYVGGYAFDPSFLGGNGTLWLWSTCVVMVVGVGVYAWRRAGHGDTGALGLLLVWLAGSLILYYIAVVDRGAFNVRYASFVTPALYLLVGVAVAGWGRLWSPLGVLAFVVVAAGLGPAIRADLYDARFAREDIAGVTEWLRERAGADDMIFVDQKYPFGFYYQRYTMEGDAVPNGPEAAAARYLFVDVNTIDARLTEWAGDARRVFWVQWFESDTDPRRAVSFLLDKEGRRGGEEWFQGYSIDWWELEPPTRFELAPGMQAARSVFVDGVTLAGAVETVEMSLPEGALMAGGKAPVVVRWQRVPGGMVGRPLKARVALYTPEEGRIAQNDQRILNDRHLLPAEWGFEDRPLNVYMLDVPEDAQAGVYTLRLLVYDADTLEALTLLDGAGNPVGQEALLGEVAVELP